MMNKLYRKTYAALAVCGSVYVLAAPIKWR